MTTTRTQIILPQIGTHVRESPQLSPKVAVMMMKHFSYFNMAVSVLKQMVRWLTSAKYGCKMIWVTSLASYLQLPTTHLCSLQYQCLQSLFATKVTKFVRVQCYGEPTLSPPSRLFVSGVNSLHQPAHVHLQGNIATEFGGAIDEPSRSECFFPGA